MQHYDMKMMNINCGNLFKMLFSLPKQEEQLETSTNAGAEHYRK